MEIISKVVKCKPTLDSFKNSVSRYISQFPDHPPVPGIASDNSLLTLLSSPWRNDAYYDGGRAASEGDDSAEEDRFLMASDD